MTDKIDQKVERGGPIWSNVVVSIDTTKLPNK